LKKDQDDEQLNDRIVNEDWRVMRGEREEDQETSTRETASLYTLTSPNTNNQAG
jgi:hypothetical protein